MDSDSTRPKAFFKTTFSDSAMGWMAALILSNAASIASKGLDSWLHKSIIQSSDSLDQLEQKDDGLSIYSDGEELGVLDAEEQE